MIQSRSDQGSTPTRSAGPCITAGLTSCKPRRRRILRLTNLVARRISMEVNERCNAIGQGDLAGDKSIASYLPVREARWSEMRTRADLSRDSVHSSLDG